MADSSQEVNSMQGEHKKSFYRDLAAFENALHDRFKSKFLIDDKTYERIREALEEKRGVKSQHGARFKFWSNRHFALQEVGVKAVVHCAKTNKPVARREEIFDIIDKCHQAIGHARRQATWNEVTSHFSWIKHECINIYLRGCAVCANHVRFKKTPSARPVVVGFLTHVQVDLIDFSNTPDNNCKWLLHIWDHFSKFSWAFPLHTKQISDVSNKMNALFSMFGPPKWLHCDNGLEFAESVVKELKKMWPALERLDERLRSEKTRGTSKSITERLNRDLKNRLEKWIDENNKGWSHGLCHVVYAMNTSSRLREKSPYEIVFGQKPKM